MIREKKKQKHGVNPHVISETQSFEKSLLHFQRGWNRRKRRRPSSISRRMKTWLAAMIQINAKRLSRRGAELKNENWNFKNCEISWLRFLFLLNCEHLLKNQNLQALNFKKFETFWLRILFSSLTSSEFLSLQILKIKKCFIFELISERQRGTSSKCPGVRWKRSTLKCSRSTPTCKMNLTKTTDGAAGAAAGCCCCCCAAAAASCCCCLLLLLLLLPPAAAAACCCCCRIVFALGVRLAEE